MRKMTVRYGDHEWPCMEYSTSQDAVRIGAVCKTWKTFRDAVRAVRDDAKAPQVPSAFSQAFCCLKMGLLEVRSTGADFDALRPAEQAPEGYERVEIKCTTNEATRNDVLLYDRSISGKKTIDQAVRRKRVQHFDWLYWMRCDADLTHWTIYRIPYAKVRDWAENSGHGRDIRSGRVGVALSRIVEWAKIGPELQGTF